MKYYFDNAATTFPKPTPVIEAMTKCLQESAVNAGRGAYELAFVADKTINDTRLAVGKLLGKNNGRVIFSPSATIALNQVLLGLPWRNGDIVYMTPFEHNAVARVTYELNVNRGVEVDRLAFDCLNLEFSLEEIKKQFFHKPPKVVVMSHASNVFGTITPVDDIARLAKEYGACVIVDGTQIGPLLPGNTDGVDFYIFSGHKTFYGPFGIAGFWTNGVHKLTSILFGGTGSHSEQLSMPDEYPFSQEIGSPNIVSIAGLQASCAWLKQIGVQNIVRHERVLLQHFFDGVQQIRGVRCWPHNVEQSVGIASIVFDEYTPQEAGMIFNQQFSTAVRAGLHCAPMAHECLETKPRGTVRISFGWFNELEEVDELVNYVRKIADSN